MQTLSGKVTVITGASSGLGRAAAIQLAEQGAKVVLAARREDALQQTAEYCRQAGGFAATCVTDVTRESDMQRLLECALSINGEIDVWINNAGVTLFAKLDDAPFAEHRRVIETNLLGSVLGARVVLPVFRRQARGVLINVGSALSKIGQPFVPSYVISKFGVRGLSEALRVDLAEYPDVHVCTFLPYAFDSQHFEAGGNYVGEPAHAMQPVQTPQAVARALVKLVKHPQRERHMPRWIVLGFVAHTIFPRLTERVLLRALKRFHFEHTAEPRGAGTLFDSSGQNAAIVGARPPLVSSVGFFIWAAKELCVVSADMTFRRVVSVLSNVARIGRYLGGRCLRFALGKRPSALAAV